MAFCTNCGSQVPDGTKFCPGCGTKISATEPVAQSPQTPAPQKNDTSPAQQNYQAPQQQSYTPLQQQSYQAQGDYQAPQQGYQPQGGAQQGYSYATAAQAPKQKKPMNKKTLFIVGGAVLAVILAIVLIGVLSRKGDDTNEVQNNLQNPAAGLQQTQDGGNSTAATEKFKENWVGTWYGVFDVMDGTGKYEANAYQRYDAYMVVSVEANGEGRFAVYLDGGSIPFAAGSCTAKDNALFSVEGSVLDTPMNISNWMFLPVPDKTDEYCATDEFTDADGDVLEYNFFFKPWGADWNPDPDKTFPIVPPGLSIYNARVANGEQPPYGTTN